MFNAIMRGARSLGVYGIAPLIAAALAASMANAAEIAISIDNFTFSPQRLVVQAGTTVTWTNHDDIPHTIVASGKAFRSKVIDTDEKFSFTFMTVGSFEYFCSLHPHMIGTIVVEATPDGVPSP